MNESLFLQLIDLGLTHPQAKKITAQITQDLKIYSPETCWQHILQELITIKCPFSIHQLLYKTIYPDWEKTPAPAWLPNEDLIKTSHLAKLMKEKGYQDDYLAFHRWSAQQYPDFWQTMTNILHIHFDKPYHSLVDLSAGIESPQWFSGGKLNIINSCFQTDTNSTAIISQSEHGKIIYTSYHELDRLSNRVANGLSSFLEKGAKVAIIMPMTREAVTLFLGIIKAGCIVVGIPDSFSSDEIATRLRISPVKAVFCQDQILRDNKSIPLYERVITSQTPCTIVLSANAALTVPLRKQDIQWKDFLSHNETFTAVSCTPQEHINILFSSGTTGEPKAIPWTHTTPIKCASDAYLHHNIEPGDIFCWPTNLGWMMGPWLIFACLLNKATLALYEGTPNGKNFGRFIQEAQITHLGVVPTLVKTWRNSMCVEDMDWSKIKLFTSTGERSNIDDMLYLMSLANYRPIIEYCGGTEIGGAYITSTVIQPSAPSAFTTAALGLDFVLLDENGALTDNGEVALIPPSIGLSTELLNKDHHQVYYANMPKLPNGTTLRHHGDQVERCANGFYRLLGRVDDTMKLSGIKVSSVEIESILNRLPFVFETAAVANNPPHGGPTQLIIYAVLKEPNNIINISQLKADMQKAIKEHLNPLFKIHDVVVIAELPRTASNKMMRRALRDQYSTNQ